MSFHTDFVLETVDSKIKTNKNNQPAKKQDYAFPADYSTKSEFNTNSNNNNQQPAEINHSFWNIEYYSKYFNIDTSGLFFSTSQNTELFIYKT